MILPRFPSLVAWNVFFVCREQHRPIVFGGAPNRFWENRIRDCMHASLTVICKRLIERGSQCRIFFWLTFCKACETYNQRRYFGTGMINQRQKSCGPYARKVCTVQQDWNQLTHC